MNEFVAKKLGEVLAFSQAGVSIFEKGETAIKSTFEGKYDEVLASLHAQAEKITSLSTELGSNDITLAKAEKTKAKLLSMAEMYVGDQWDNPAELLEWLGFFEGAAIVHWKLVRGAAQTLQKEQLTALSEEGIALHTQVLTTVGELIEKYAQSKA